MYYGVTIFMSSKYNLISTVSASVQRDYTLVSACMQAAAASNGKVKVKRQGLKPPQQPLNY